KIKAPPPSTAKLLNILLLKLWMPSIEVVYPFRIQTSHILRPRKGLQVSIFPGISKCQAPNKRRKPLVPLQKNLLRPQGRRLSGIYQSTWAHGRAPLGLAVWPKCLASKIKCHTCLSHLESGQSGFDS
ncbi:hypothetical protein CCACVL1_28050, partial [Corchorus capsularis]